MRGLTRGKLSLNGVILKKVLIAVVITAFFAFGDFPIFVYVIKVLAILGLLILSKCIRYDSYLRWIVFFAIWSLSSIIWATDKDIVFFYFIWYLQAVLLAFSIGTSINDISDIEFVLKCIVVGSTLLSIRTLYGISLSSFGTFRLGDSIGSNPNELALKASLGCIIAFRYFHEEKKRRYKILYLVAIIIPLIVVLFSESRKGILMVFIALFIYSIINSSNQIKFLRNTLMAIIGVMIVYYLMMHIEFFYNSFGRRFMLLFNIFDEGAYVGNSIGNRLNAVELGMNAFIRKPIIGFGLGNFMVATGLRGYSHNNYIQILVDLGIVGIVLYYTFYIKNLFGMITTIKYNRSLTSMLLSMMLVIIVIEYGLVSFNSDYVQLVLMLGFYIVRINKDEKIKGLNQTYSLV